MTKVGLLTGLTSAFDFPFVNLSLLISGLELDHDRVSGMLKSDRWIRQDD
jgi:hypothetical protein